MVPDTRHPDEICAETHAFATYRGCSRLVRGIDRFTHLPTREPAAMVWLMTNALLGAQLVPIALSDITIHPRSQS